MRLLLAAALARLAPLAVNELPPVSVAVTPLGSFKVLVIVTGLLALTVPTPTDTSAVPIVTDGPKVVRPELWVKVPMAVLAGLKVPPFTSTVVMLLPLVPVVPPETVRLAMLSGIAQVHRAGGDGRGAKLPPNQPS